MSDLNFCQNCQRVSGITEDFRCLNCAELICVICGYADCEWARPGVCGVCAEENLSGKKFYNSLSLSKNQSFESLTDKDQLVFNLIAETANEIMNQKRKNK
jgi:hypothetical protein